MCVCVCVCVRACDEMSVSLYLCKSLNALSSYSLRRWGPINNLLLYLINNITITAYISTQTNNNFH